MGDRVRAPLTSPALPRALGSPHRPGTELVTVQRRVSAAGVITVGRQQIALGRVHAGRIVSVHMSEHTLAIEVGDDTRSVRRTTPEPVVVIKGSRARIPPAPTNRFSRQAQTSNPHHDLQDP